MPVTELTNRTGVFSNMYLHQEIIPTSSILALLVTTTRLFYLDLLQSCSSELMESKIVAVELRHRCKRVDVACLSNHGVTNVLDMRVVIISEWSTPPPNSYTHQLRLVMDLSQRTQSSQTEGRVVLAIQAFNQGHFSSLYAASTAYGAPYSTVRRRVSGRVARHDSRPTNLKLTPTEESILVQWILSMDERGLPPRADSVRQMANLLLQKRSNIEGVKVPQVGRCWVRNFVRRHQALGSRYNRKYDYQRAKCEDSTIIRDWFRLVQNIIAKYGIQKEDIYNFD